MVNRIKVHRDKVAGHSVELHVLTGDEDNNRDYVRDLVERGGFKVADRGRWDQLPRMARLGVGWEANDANGMQRLIDLLAGDPEIELNWPGAKPSGAKPGEANPPKS
jgi:hypothetical protein